MSQETQTDISTSVRSNSIDNGMAPRQKAYEKISVPLYPGKSQTDISTSARSKSINNGMAPRRKDPKIVLQEECLEFIHKRLFKEKVTRTDVALRKVENKEVQCSVVKTTLNTFCKPEGRSLPLDAILLELNKTVSEAYILANLHVVRMCQTQQNVPKLDQSFFYGCLSAVSCASKRKTAIRDKFFRESVEEYLSWRPSDYVPPDSTFLSSGWHQNISLQMATNTKNSTSTMFYKRFARYLKHKYMMDGKQAYLALKSIIADEYHGDDQLILRYRAKIPQSTSPVEDTPHLVMHLQHEFLEYFEHTQSMKHEESDRESRLFSLLPTKAGFECNHFKMCNNGLYGLLRRAGVSLPGEVKSWRAQADTWWRKLFNIEQFETTNRKFAHEVLTDGKAVSIVLKKPKVKKPESAEPVKLSDFGEIWGLDPGRTDTFVASNKDGDKQFCSTKEFYEDAKYKESNRTIAGWHERDPGVREAIRNMPSKKTASVAKFQAYTVFLLPRLDMLLEFHMRKGFRQLKFKRYRFAQKKLQQLCRKLTARCGEKTLVGFGDWSNKDSIIKKSPKGPVKRFENQLKRYCTVIPVDEFRTSKLHACCEHAMENQYSMKKVKDKGWRCSKVHSVLHCKHSGCNGMTVNRDVNASLNMLRLLKQHLTDGTRPAAFCRGEASTTRQLPLGTRKRAASSRGSRCDK